MEVRGRARAEGDRAYISRKSGFHMKQGNKRGKETLEMERGRVYDRGNETNEEAVLSYRLWLHRNGFQADRGSCFSAWSDPPFGINFSGFENKCLTLRLLGYIIDTAMHGTGDHPITDNPVLAGLSCASEEAFGRGLGGAFPRVRASTVDVVLKFLLVVSAFRSFRFRCVRFRSFSFDFKSNFTGVFTCTNPSKTV